MSVLVGWLSRSWMFCNVIFVIGFVLNVSEYVHSGKNVTKARCKCFYSSNFRGMVGGIVIVRGRNSVNLLVYMITAKKILIIYKGLLNLFNRLPCVLDSH